MERKAWAFGGFCVSCLSGIIELDYPWSVLFYVMISFSAINSNRRALLFVSFLHTYQDKWRNLSVSTSGQGSKDKLRTSKVKIMAAASVPNVQNSSPAPPVRHNASAEFVMVDPSNSTQEGKNAPR